MKLIKHLALILLLLTPVVTLDSCQTMNNKEQQIQREKNRRAKGDTVLYQKALKRHMKSQTKETRKSMRRAMYEAKRNREHKREFFVKRWFKGWFGYKQERNKG